MGGAEVRLGKMALEQKLKVGQNTSGRDWLAKMARNWLGIDWFCAGVYLADCDDFSG